MIVRSHDAVSLAECVDLEPVDGTDRHRKDNEIGSTDDRVVLAQAFALGP